MRLATFNVENLFQRAKAMNLTDWSQGEDILKDFAKLNQLIQKPEYTLQIKSQLIEIMQKYKGLITTSESTYIRLRVIRGKFIDKPKNKPPVIKADGRDDWIGWFELEKESITEKAIENTGRVIGLLEPDILCVIEAESRICLKQFNDSVLPHVKVNSFDHVMLIDGNDTRGIDVGIMTRAPYFINRIASHIDDADETGTIFSRDCAEYEVNIGNGNSILVMVNHFKSKGYGNAITSDKKRLRQATRVREIYEERLANGFEYIAIVGDLNAGPNESSMDSLIRQGSSLIDIMVHPKFIGDGRPGTHGNGTASAKLDYILMSPKLSNKVIKGGIERRGIWGGKNGTLFPHLPTMDKEKDSASDHAALWVDLNI